MLRIGNKDVGDGAPCYVIAEAGSNHDGSLDQARSLVKIASKAGADAVKFQTFKASTMYPRRSGTVDYLERLGVSASIYDIVESLEMPYEWIKELAGLCEEQGLHFLSTPFDEASVDALEPFVQAFKIASYELTHIPLIRYAARRGKPMILSTGAGTMEEIGDAAEAVRAEGNDQICLTQCTAKYPAPLDSINVAVIPALKEAFGVAVGLSDHSEHPTIAPSAAVAVGANIIEKHFTLSKRLPGPDHSYALEPDELATMVETIRLTERATGSALKGPQPVEAELSNYRRSIYTRRPLEKGHRLTTDDLIVLRRPGHPGTGLEPMHLSLVLGRELTRDVPEQEILGPDDMEPRVDV